MFVIIILSVFNSDSEALNVGDNNILEAKGKGYLEN